MIIFRMPLWVYWVSVLAGILVGFGIGVWTYWYFFKKKSKENKNKKQKPTFGL